MVWKIDDPQGNESEKIKWELVPYTRGTGLDLGCGPYKAFPHFIGVDNGHHDAEFGWKNNANIQVETCEDLSVLSSQSMDFVYSSHLLEHIEETKKALKEWWRVLKVGGYLCLYLPHKEYYPNIGEPGANPDHKHDFLPQDIVDVMSSVGSWDLVENQERNEGREYSFFQVYKKTNSKHRFSYLEPKPDKTVAVIRYGAFGDVLMASSVFPQLKAQGYHVTLFTVPGAYEVVKHDPNIDAFVIQDRDQVPNTELPAYWAYLSKKYTKVINLSESVEGAWLPIPGRTSHAWPDSVRRKYLDTNYLEFAHDLSEVPYKPAVRFYPTETEREWARKERARMGRFVILWSLSGSSVHKIWPHLDAALAALMVNHRDVDVVLVGDEMCQMLEAGWDKEKRIHRRSGVWSIRQSMAFIEQADCVVGGETGLVNAAAFLPVPKIITLSHSSVENLTRDWVNTTSLASEIDCYPCHRMHYGFEFCRQEETTGCAQCQYDIGADSMVFALEKVIDKWRQAAA